MLKLTNQKDQSFLIDLRRTIPKFMIFALEKSLEIFDHDEYPMIKKSIYDTIDLWKANGVGSQKWLDSPKWVEMSWKRGDIVWTARKMEADGTKPAYVARFAATAARAACPGMGESQQELIVEFIIVGLSLGIMKGRDYWEEMAEFLLGEVAVNEQKTD